MMCSRLSRLVLGAGVCAAPVAIQFAVAAWLLPANAQDHAPQIQTRRGETDAMRRAGELARDANRHFDTLMPKVTGGETAPSRIAQAQPQPAVKPVGTTGNTSQLSPIWSWLETSNREYQRVIVRTLSTGGPASQSIASRRGERPADPVAAPVPDSGPGRPQPRSPSEGTSAVVAEQKSAQSTSEAPQAAQPPRDPGTFEQMQVAVQKWFSRANREYNSQIVKRLADQGAGPAAPTEQTRTTSTVAAVPPTTPPLAPTGDAGRADSARQLSEAAKKAELQRREEQGRRMIELAEEKARREAAARQIEQQKKAAEAKQAAELAARARAEEAERVAQDKQRQQQAAELAKREQQRKEAEAVAERHRAEERRRAEFAAAEQKRQAALREAEARKREAARQVEQRRLAEEKRKAEEAEQIAAARAEAERRRAASREQEAARLARLQVAQERRAIERAREQRIAKEANEEAERQVAERRLMEAARRAEQEKQAAALKQRSEASGVATSRKAAEPVAKAGSAQKRRVDEDAKRVASTGKAVVAKRSSRSRKADRKRAADRKRTVVNIVSAPPAQAPPPTIAAGVPDAKLKVVRRSASRSKPRASAQKGRKSVRKRKASTKKATRSPAKSYGHRASRSGLGAQRERTKKTKGRPSSKSDYKYRSRKKRNSCRHDAGLKVVPGQHYVVMAGDSLWGIAEKHYNDGSKFPLLLNANRALIRDPDNMEPCLKLMIPHAA